ncbi:MAG TPA: hypothetical protein VF548_11140 [Allosphingosinicella sp.]|jgi:hypothetical protein
MLAAFQRALTDLTASPALCRAAREDPALLASRYRLTEKEARRLNGIVRSRGMEANCSLYRANRLVPVALNCPRLCALLDEDLKRLISLYWESEPRTNVHFLFEADRFCRFLAGRDDLPEGAAEILEREHGAIAARLAATRAMSGHDAFDC